jgi:hypothetical protein
MRRLSGLLMGLGAFVGVLMGIAVFVGAERFGLTWIVWVGMIKLGVAGAIGLMAAGAFMRRTARRRELRETGASNRD